MSFVVPVYIVVVPTGEFDEEGREKVILLESKLTKIAADQTALKTTGARVMKMIADKEVPDEG